MTIRSYPPPRTDGLFTLEQAIAARRTRREFPPDPLTTEEIGQLFWAAQGITGPEGRLRAAPSAMEAYPLEFYVATAYGLDHYRPEEHGYARSLEHDCRPDLRAAAHDQESVTSAPAVFVVTAIHERARAKLGPGSEAYVHMDLGHAAQNLLLQATALELAAVPIAWLEPDRVRAALDLPSEEVPLYLVPVGRRPRES